MRQHLSTYSTYRAFFNIPIIITAAPFFQCCSQWLSKFVLLLQCCSQWLSKFVLLLQCCSQWLSKFVLLLQCCSQWLSKFVLLLQCCSQWLSKFVLLLQCCSQWLSKFVLLLQHLSRRNVIRLHFCDFSDWRSLMTQNSNKQGYTTLLTNEKNPSYMTGVFWGGGGEGGCFRYISVIQ